MEYVDRDFYSARRDRDVQLRSFKERDGFWSLLKRPRTPYENWLSER